MRVKTSEGSSQRLFTLLACLIVLLSTIAGFLANGLMQEKRIEEENRHDERMAEIAAGQTHHLLSTNQVLATAAMMFAILAGFGVLLRLAFHSNCKEEEE